MWSQVTLIHECEDLFPLIDFCQYAQQQLTLTIVELGLLRVQQVEILEDYKLVLSQVVLPNVDEVSRLRHDGDEDQEWGSGGEWGESWPGTVEDMNAVMGKGDWKGWERERMAAGKEGQSGEEDFDNRERRTLTIGRGGL